MALRKELRDRMAEMAEELRRAVYREGGCPEWGTSFTDLEAMGVDLGDALAQLFTSQAVQQQAHDLDEDTCPCVCGHQASRRIAKGEPGWEARTLTTRRGELAWLEKEYYCERCRKSFFPSVQSAGDRSRRHG